MLKTNHNSRPGASSPRPVVGDGNMFSSLRLDEGVLSSQAAQQLRELIQSGELRAGDRLPSERVLSERLGVSRTVVREAIKLLRAEGIVRVRLGVGTFVTEPPQNILSGPLSYLNQPESKKIEDLLQVRNVLEPAIAALAAKNATREHIARMEQAIQEMDQNMADGDRYIVSDNLFHVTLAEASGNSVFQMLVNSFIDLLQKSRRLAVSVPGATKRANTFHRRVLAAIVARDPHAASAAMEDHLHQLTHEVHTAMTKPAARKNSAR